MKNQINKLKNGHTHRGPKPVFQTEIVKKFRAQKGFTTGDVAKRTQHSYQTTRAAVNKLIEKGVVQFTGNFKQSGGRPEQVLKINQGKANAQFSKR